MFELGLQLLIGIVEKQVQKSIDKGKRLKALQKIFSEEAQEKVAKLYQVYTTAAIELEDELAEANEEQ